MNRIEYQLTEEDLIRFNLYYSAHSELHKRQRRRHRLLVPVVYAVLAGLCCMSRSFIVASVLAAFALVWFLVSPAWLRWRFRKHYEKHIRETKGETLKEPMTLELQPDGICTSSAVGESKFRYSAVDQIVENEGYTYVFISKAMALILPHDRIAQETITALVAEISRRKQEADATPDSASKSAGHYGT